MSAPVASLRKTAITGATWSLAETWLVRVFSLLVFVILGRLLTPADFGTVAAAALFVDLVGLFIGTGLSTYLVQATDIDETETSTAFWTGLLSAGVLGSLVFAAAPLTAPLFDTPDLVPMVRWLAVGLVFAGLVGVPTGLLQRRLQFRQLAMRSITATAVSGIIAVVLAFNGAGAWSLVAQALVFAAVRTGSVWVGAQWWPSLRFSLSSARRMLGYSLNVIGLSLLQFVRSRGEEFLLALLAGPVALGTWVIAKRLVKVVIEVSSGVVTRVATPVFARAKSSPIRLVRGYTTAMTLSTAVVSPVLCLLAAVSQEAVPLVFGEQWRSSGAIAALLALGLVFLSASYLDRGLLLAINQSGLALRVSAVAVASHLAVAAVVLGTGASLTQLAAALAIRSTCFWPVRLLTIRRVIDLDMWRLVLQLCRVWVAAGLSGAAAWLVLLATRDTLPTWAGVGVAGSCGAVGYLMALWVANRPVLRDLLATARAVVRR